MPTTQPRSLRELSLWLIGGDEMAASLRTVCDVEVLRPDSWEGRLNGDDRAFLLVEGNAAVATAWDETLDPFLETCDNAGIPRLLWFTSSAIGQWWPARCGHFDQVFAAERWQVPELEAAGVREPSTLWPGTPCPLHPEPRLDAEERADSVIWLGGWNRAWPVDWRARLAAVLRGAEKRGLRIVPVAELDGLPSDLQGCVAAAEADSDPREALRHTKVAIGADPVVGSPTFVPPVVFDAAVCGAAVLTPHDFVSVHEMAIGDIADGSWRNMVPIVHDGDITVEELHRLLDDDQYRIEVVRHMRQIVANNHTFAHRVATLASAAGHRVLHEPAVPVVV